MLNALILGSKGNLGRYICDNAKDLSIKIFTNEDKDISKVLNNEFILENNICLIINCIGENTNSSNYFHSNFYVTSFLTFFLLSLDEKITKTLNVIHFSSVGIHNPYKTFSCDIVKDRIYPPMVLDLNKYELSKRCSDSLISTIPKYIKNINIQIIEPSVLINKNAIFMKKLFILLAFFPFKLPKETFPGTNLSSIKKYLNELIHSLNTNKNQLSHFKRIQLIDNISIKPLTKKIPLYKFRIKASRNLTLIIIKVIRTFNPKSNISKVLSLFLFD